MNRFVSFAGAALMALLGFTGGAGAQEYTMRIASGSNSAGFACTDFLTGWAEKIKAESGGRIDYQLYCDGTLGKMGDTVSRVQDGVAEAGWDVPLSYGGRFAAFGVVGLPGLFDDPSLAAGALWKALEAGQLPPVEGVKLAMLQVTGNIGLWTTEPVADLSALQGLKVAMGSKERAIILEQMGGVPLNLRVPEYYQALSKGSADGLFTTDSAIFDFSMTEVAKHSYRAPFGGGIIGVFINQQWYDGLPDDLKQVIDANTGYLASRWAADLLWQEEQRLLQEAQAAGVEIRALTDAELAAWQPAFAAATQNWVDALPDGAKYLDAFKAALLAEASN